MGTKTVKHVGIFSLYISKITKIYHNKDMKEKAITIWGMFLPMASIPQAIDVWNGNGASLLTWSFFLMNNGIWLLYAVDKNLKAEKIYRSLWGVMSMVIVAGIIFA